MTDIRSLAALTDLELKIVMCQRRYAAARADYREACALSTGLFFGDVAGAQEAERAATRARLRMLDARDALNVVLTLEEPSGAGDTDCKGPE